MGTQIIKQPNGKLALYSSICDNFTMVNAEEQDIVDFFVEEQTRDIRCDVARRVLALNRGEKPYHQFTRTFQEALDTIKRLHGTVESNSVLKLIEEDDDEQSDDSG